MGNCHCLENKGGKCSDAVIEHDIDEKRPLVEVIIPQTPVAPSERTHDDFSESGESDVEGETIAEPKQIPVPRRGGVCAEQISTGAYFKLPYWNKHEGWEQLLRKWLRSCATLKDLDQDELNKIVRAMSTHIYYKNDHTGGLIAQAGESGDGLLVVLEGNVNVLKPKGGVAHQAAEARHSYVDAEVAEEKKAVVKDDVLKSHAVGAVIDEIMIIWSSPRPYTLVCGGSQCILAQLSRVDFMNIVVRSKVYKWWGRQDYLRNAGLLEMLEDEQIAKLVDCLRVKVVEAGGTIIQQGDEGRCFYILAQGEARVWVKTGSDDEQEYKRYHGGELFGELAPLNNVKRAANVQSVTRCLLLCLSRRQFERLLGPMKELNQQQYLTDPRKLISDFYGESDSRGPAGTLMLNKLNVDLTKGDTQWFAVYRPTSRDAIAKMLSGAAVGKGLNVKGKSAKQGVLSGFVPFCQISDNKHKSMIENSPPKARLQLYFRNKASREEAHKKLVNVMAGMPVKSIEQRSIEMLEDYVPKVYGLNIPEPLLREAYLMMPDLSPVMGWETGRRSEPAFMDFNLHAVRDESSPKVVLYQNDEADAMNPRGLLIAYAEKLVKPVVSDFDTFLVASRGMDYEPLPDDQAELVDWLLGHTESILEAPDHNPWTVRWLEVLKKENERGFHPKFPKYGYGDPTSYRLIGDIVKYTEDSGAVRHGAECFNFYFPQELDDEYLCVWTGFPEKPWSYKTEPELRAWLIERIAEGYCFPLNPVWPVRDKGWNDVLQCLLGTQAARECIEAWFPEKRGILDRLVKIQNKCPQGFIQSADVAEANRVEKEKQQRQSKVTDIKDENHHDAKAVQFSTRTPKKSVGYILKDNMMTGLSRTGSWFLILKRKQTKSLMTAKSSEKSDGTSSVNTVKEHN